MGPARQCGTCGQAIVRFAYVAVALGVLTLWPASVGAAMYRNEDYGFSAEPPPSLAVCTTTPPGSNHGFELLLETKDCEANRVGHDWIDVYVGYNTIHEPASTRELASLECRDAVVKHRVLVVREHVFDSCDIPDPERGRAFRYVALLGGGKVLSDISAELLVTVYYSDRKRLPRYREIAEHVIRSFVFW